MLHRRSTVTLVTLAVATMGLISGCRHSPPPTRPQEPPPDLPTPCRLDGHHFRLATFNMRAGIIPDGKNSWIYRRDLAIEVIRAIDPDILGTQETVGTQHVDVVRGLPEWNSAGEACFGGTFGEYTTVFYRADRLEEKASGTFWLSDTPEKRGTNTWKSMAPRQCTWSHLACQGCGYEFVVFNTHFDHRNEEARKKSAALIAERIRARQADLPCILLGDLNMTPDDERVFPLLGAPADSPSPSALMDAWPAAETREGGPGTGNWFRGGESTRRIDHIAVPFGTRVERMVVDTTTKEGRFPSDHYPVYADVVLAPRKR